MRESTRYIMTIGTKEIGDVVLYVKPNDNDFIIVNGKLHQIIAIRPIVNHDVKVMRLSAAYENDKH